MKNFLLIAILGALPLLGQTQTKVSPDCTTGIQTFTGTGSGTTFDNRPTSANTGIPCTIWALAWSAQSAVTSITINIQGAPDSAGTPGSFTTLASGSTFASGKVVYSSSTSYSPWMRINVSAVGAGGTITAILNGWRDDQASIAGGGGGGGSGCPGTTGTPCVVVGPTAAGMPTTTAPVLTAGTDGTDVRTILTDNTGRPQVLVGYDGAAQPVSVGTSQKSITVSAGTDVVLVSGTASKKTYITKFDISWDNSAIATLRQGTTSSTPCDTTTVALSGGYNNLVALFEDYGSNFSTLTTSSTALDICLHFSTSVTGGGQVFYNQH